MTKPAVFTQTDIAKLLRGAARAGATVTRIEIEPGGKIVAMLGETNQSEGEADEWTRRIHAKRKERST